MFRWRHLALDHIQAVLTGVRGIAEPTRMLAIVLLTDTVISIVQAQQLNDGG